jgi:hypothetical protein
MKTLIKYTDFFNESKKSDRGKVPKPKYTFFNIAPKTMDNEIFKFVDENFSDYFYKSPWSHSYYDQEVSWSNKPEGSYRISDHWNFRISKDNDIHCVTRQKVENNTHWSIGKYDSSEDVYDIIASYEFTNADEKYINELKRKYLKQYQKTKEFKEYKNKKIKSDKYINIINQYSKEVKLLVNNDNYILNKISRNKISLSEIGSDKNINIKYNNFERADIKIYYKGALIFDKPIKSDIKLFYKIIDDIFPVN